MTTIILDTEEKRRVYQALQLKHAIRLYNATGMMVTRGATPRRLLDAAGATTGAKYPNSERGRARCLADLETYLTGKSLAAAPVQASEEGAE